MTTAEPARKISVSKPSLSDIPEVGAPKSALISHGGQESGSRRSSRDNTSRRSSLGISFNATVKILRSGQNARRMSRSKIVVMPEPSGDADVLDKLPLPANPRFTSTMSVEAQYTILKCYEERLLRLLTDSYPDYSSLLRRTDSPSNTKVALKRQNAHEDNEDDHEDHEESEESEESDDDSEDGFRMRSTRSLPPNVFARASSPKRPAMPQSARPVRQPNARVPHQRQLALSRRLQMAHKLLDTVTERPTAGATKEKLNPIQGYNLWANGWRQEFDVKEEPEPLK